MRRDAKFFAPSSAKDIVIARGAAGADAESAARCKQYQQTICHGLRDTALTDSPLPYPLLFPRVFR